MLHLMIFIIHGNSGFHDSEVHGHLEIEVDISLVPLETLS